MTHNNIVCGRRYKTLSVLKAHRTTYHSQEAFSHVEERTEKKHDNEGGSVMKIRDAKPNGYCDFCLGDDNLNKKTNKPEKLVSCADCGRSGTQLVYLVILCSVRICLIVPIGHSVP